jgi:hypothetical protein
MKFSFTEVLFGKCWRIYPNTKQNYKDYLLLKEFVKSKLCVKELLSYLNKIDKLKAILLDESQRKLAEEIPNPFPTEHAVKNLWKTKQSLNEKQELEEKKP